MSDIQMSLFEDQPEFTLPTGKDSMLARLQHPISRTTVFETTVSEETLQNTNNIFRMQPPKDGQCFHYLTDGAFNLTSYLVWLQLQLGKLKRVLVSAWSFGAADVWNILQMCDKGKILQLDILASDQHPKRHKMEHQMFLYMRYKGKLHNYWVAPIHSKLILIETSDGRFYTVNSAANCTMKAQIEVAAVTCGRDVYEFYNNLFTDMDIFSVSDAEKDPDFNIPTYEQAKENHSVLYGD